MSARALNWAFEQRPKTTSQKLVLVALADRADEDGLCWPGVAWITQKCSPINPETARRVLRELSDQALIEKVRRRQRRDGTFSTWLLRLPIDQRALVPAGELEWEDEASGHECPVGQRALVTTPAGTGARADSIFEPKSEKNPDGFFSIVDRWISLAPPLIAHKRDKLEHDQKLKTSVRNAVKEHTLAEVIVAITNYATVLSSTEHYFEHRWTLRLFLTQRNALPQFLHEADPLTNYRTRTAPSRDRGVSFSEILKGGSLVSDTDPRPGLPRAS